MEEQIKKYQRACWKSYKEQTNIPDNYSYLWGNPVKVHVPVDTAQKGVMIIGAYPTAHFNTINSIRDVPVGDHLYPFSNEHYFDGSSVRAVKSGQELDEYYLKPLGISREECWITDLVKVFLFKDGHIKKYNQLNYEGYLLSRSRFTEIAHKSMSFIHQEIRLAKPKVILTLGSEVSSVIMKIPLKEITKLMNDKPYTIEVYGDSYDVFALPHPGIIMRNSEISNKWKHILQKQITQIKELINES